MFSYVCISMLYAWLAVVGVIISLIVSSNPLDNLPETLLKRQNLPQVRVFSFDPLILHIEDFVSRSERDHLLKLASGNYDKSHILAENGTRVLSNHRTSSTAFLPSNDSLVHRVRRRAAEVQGFTDLDYIEKLQATRYEKGQQFRPHYDTREILNGKMRGTTIFATLDATCAECGTQFPELSVEWHKKDPAWCKFFECNSPLLTAKAVPGAALLWRNIHANRSVDERMLHAGLPVEQGSKVGLNIWTTIQIQDDERISHQ